MDGLEIDIKQTSSHYLLRGLPYAQRVRAKRIPGYAWDPDRRCWKYPRSEAVRQALIQEFGCELPGDLDGQSVPRQRLAKAANTNLAQEGMAIPDLADVQKQLTIAQASYSAVLTELSSLKTRVEGQDKAADLVRRELLSSQHKYMETVRELEACKNHLAEARSALKTALEQNDRLTKKADEPSANLDRMLMKAAINCCDKDPSFARLVETHEFGESLPVFLLSKITDTLIELLGPREFGTATFGKVLDAAKDKGLLSREGLDMAHLVKKTRHLVAHEGHKLHPKTKMARTIICLFAAALVWRELSTKTPSA